MQITLRQVEVFLAVARAGSFRAAAEVLHLSQPALSQHVAELERELGARLFDRLNRRVALTEAGTNLRGARTTRPRDPCQRARDRRRARGAEARLAADRRQYHARDLRSPSPRRSLPEAVPRDHPARADRQFSRHRGTDPRQRARSRRGRGTRVPPGEECLAKGMRDELVLIVPPGHRWSRRREIAPNLLGAERLLIREEGSASRQVTERALQHVGPESDPRWSWATPRRSSRR